jgi:hypothetical protein
MVLNGTTKGSTATDTSTGKVQQGAKPYDGLLVIGTADHWQ